ncbi:glycoside hydrolase family 81 protein [Fistulina hepatica ATCC 64428]|nr:glycoside hydrolase family 81 protein [Fistulina hepatica ATCC 64428]
MDRLLQLLIVFLPVVRATLFGTIGTDYPVPPGGSVTNDQPPNSFFQGFTPPYPTNDWWVGYGAGNGDAVCAGPFPYETSLTANAIQFGISTSRNTDGVSIHQPTETDWSVGFIEHSGNARDHKAISWDSQSVTLQYFTGSSTLTTYMVPGSPYLTFAFSSATPKFTSGQGVIKSFAGSSLAPGSSYTATGTEFLVVNDIGTYIIYSLSGAIELIATAQDGGSTIIGSTSFTGVLRVVKLNDPSHKTLLDAHASVYPTAVTTDYDFYGDTATLRFTWAVVGNAEDLLMLTWPHHRIKMQAPDFPGTNALSYLTTKGYMYPALGNVWELKYDLPTITWNAPRSPDSSCIPSIIAGLEYEIAHLPPIAAPGDFYFFGGHVAMVSRLALIAEEVGRSDLVQPVITYLEAMYAFWFSSSSPTQAAYETAWGGIINRAGYNNVYVDFGNGYYNDHHFHYGYFLAAAAVISKYDANWMDLHRDFFDYFLRDIVNPSRNDPYFPVTRCRDWFAGHSWASGIANGAGSRDQESIGEAVNGYYGALLWSEVSGNTDLKNYARLLIATEQHAAQVYWHLYPGTSATDRDQPYPEQSVRNLVTMGNVMDWQAGAWLFWGNQKVQIAAIQILPVTPINEYMYDATWAQNVLSYTSSELADPAYDDAWKSVIYLAYSQANLADAATKSAALTSWGSGNSYSNQLYFLATRLGASGICSSIPSNPVGRFVVQSTSTSKYVANATLPDLYASETTPSSAAVFDLAFAPNSGTIQAVATSQYVTADQSGTFTLSAARANASTWELFVVRPKAGTASGIYSIYAVSNKQYVVLRPDDALVNSGTNEAASEGFKLISV